MYTFISLPRRYFLLLMVALTVAWMMPPCWAVDDAKERDIIESNKRKAEQSAAQAMFKVYRIRCLSSSDGKKALKACQQALAIDASDASIKKRKAELVAALTPPAPKPRPQPVQVVKPVPKPQSAPVPVVAEKEKPLDKMVKQEQEKAQKQEKETVKLVEKDNRKEEKEREKEQEKVKSREAAEKRKIVKQVQQKLNQLGFKVGTADGVAGKKTRQAIRRFQKLTKRPTKTNINRTLLTELKEVHIEHKVASELHKVAMEQQQAGRLSSALGTVKKGLKKAPWHQPLKTLRGKVTQQIAARENEKKEAEAKKIAAQSSANKTENKKAPIADDQETESIAKDQQDKDQQDKKESESIATKTIAISQKKPDAEKKSTAEQQKLLASIAAKQKKIATIDINLSMEQLVLMADAQRSLEKFADK